MAAKHGKAKHPASDHLRAAADALDEMHQQMAAKQQQQGPQVGPPGMGQGPGAVMPGGGVSPLGGQAR
jgi:hypothetical protein